MSRRELPPPEFESELEPELEDLGFWYDYPRTLLELRRVERAPAQFVMPLMRIEGQMCKPCLNGHYLSCRRGGCTCVYCRQMRVA